MLEVFLAAYIECALWTSNDCSRDDGGEPLDKNYDRGDIDEASFIAMRKDCESFMVANEVDIDGKCGDAGHDFWLTRNGHGCGFWDGDWPDDAGERLTKAAHVFGEVDMYVGDDGKIYQSGAEPIREGASDASAHTGDCNESPCRCFI